MPDAIELRCFCRKNVLLAVCGRTAEGRLFCQIKHRQGNGFAEAIVTGGIVKLRCYACTRWHTLRMKNDVPEFIKAVAPEESGLISRS